MSKWDELYQKELNKRTVALQEHMGNLYEKLMNSEEWRRTYFANFYLHTTHRFTPLSVISHILDSDLLEEDIGYLKLAPSRPIPDWQIEIREILTSMNLTYETF
jgi:hypothetical protein